MTLQQYRSAPYNSSSTIEEMRAVCILLGYTPVAENESLKGMWYTLLEENLPIERQLKRRGDMFGRETERLFIIDVLAMHGLYDYEPSEIPPEEI